MLHFSRVVIDLPLYHRSIVRIGLPYTGPGFVWCQLGRGSWTWDLQFVFTQQPPTPNPDSAFGCGIHQVHPHPPEQQANWLPRIGTFLDPQMTGPISASVTHGQHSDFLQVRVDPAGNDPNGNPQYDIKLTFLHQPPGEEKPDFDPPLPWWRWWWRMLNWICWWRRPRFFHSSTPPFGLEPGEIEDAMKPQP
jgi:hypothetical protein